jgi:hypothetical protein
MSLFWKIFVSFMIAMTATSVGAVYVTFQIASQALEQVNVEGRDRIIEEVAAALACGGERELKGWLFNNPTSAATSCSVVPCRASWRDCSRRGRCAAPPRHRIFGRCSSLRI